MGNKRTRNNKKRKCRHYSMNEDTNANVDGEEAEVTTDTNNMSASSSKIDLSVYEGKNIEDVQDINFILNIKILNNIVDLLGKCPECIQGKITASINLENKKGFAQQSVLTCICGWYHMVYSWLYLLEKLDWEYQA